VDTLLARSYGGTCANTLLEAIRGHGWDGTLEKNFQLGECSSRTGYGRDNVARKRVSLEKALEKRL
jgi:hypothetical protein